MTKQNRCRSAKHAFIHVPVLLFKVSYVIQKTGLSLLLVHFPILSLAFPTFFQSRTVNFGAIRDTYTTSSSRPVYNGCQYVGTSTTMAVMGGYHRERISIVEAPLKWGFSLMATTAGRLTTLGASASGTTNAWHNNGTTTEDSVTVKTELGVGGDDSNEEHVNDVPKTTTSKKIKNGIVKPAKKPLFMKNQSYNDTPAPNKISKAVAPAAVTVETQTTKTSTKRKTEKRTKKKQFSNNDPVYFYRNATDVMKILNKQGGEFNKGSLILGTNNHTTLVQFKVRGNPVPLARHRAYKGLMFNPSAKKQKQFCGVVLDMLPDYCFREADHHKTMEHDVVRRTENVIPIFQNQVISIQIISRMKRPKKHFIGNKPGPGRLRGNRKDKNGDGLETCVASHLQVTRTDVDNLAKFVLDSLNGILYQDDRQVASLQIVKVYDHEEPFAGSTDVIIQTMVEDDFLKFV